MKKSDLENKAHSHQAWSTFGYGLVWLFVAVLVGVLPYTTSNWHAVYFVSGGAAALAGVYKTIRGIKQIMSL